MIKFSRPLETLMMCLMFARLISSGGGEFQELSFPRVTGQPPNHEMASLKNVTVSPKKRSSCKLNDPHIFIELLMCYEPRLFIILHEVSRSRKSFDSDASFINLAP